MDGSYCSNNSLFCLRGGTVKEKMKQVLLISMLLLSILSTVNFAKAEDYQYYKEITVSNFSANYEKKITVHYGSGSDSTDVVYLNSHVQSDFDDVQFRASDKATVLKHWREEYTSSDQATFWVKLPSSSQTIYIFYDNDSASDSSDPDNVFTFFDDFDDSSIDSNKWETGTKGSGGSYQETGGNLELTASNDQTGSAYAKNKTSSTNNIVIEYNAKSSQERYNDLSYGFGEICDISCESSAWHHTVLQYSYGHLVQDDTNFIYRLLNCPNSENKENSIDGPDSGTFHRYKIIYSSTGTWEWHYDNSGWTKLGTGQTDTTHSTWGKYLLFSRGGYSGGSYGGTFYIDFVLIRKYSPTPPTFSFGSETLSNSPPTTPTNSNPSNGATDQSLNSVLQWSEYEDPDSDPQQAWEVRVDNNSDFSSPEWIGSGTTGNSTTVNTTNGDFGNDCSGQVELNEDETYHFDVRVQDDQNNWSNRSTATNFTTGEFSPTVTLLSPSDDATGQSLNPVLQLNYEDPNSDPIQNCYIVIDDNADFSSKEWWTGLLGGGAVTSLAVNIYNGEFLNNCSGQVKLDENTPYHWKAQVEDDTGRKSEWSGVFEFTTGTIPSAPTGCGASYISDSQIDLSWTDNSSNESGFKIERSIDGGEYSQITTAPENSTGTNDTTVSADHYYQYKVCSYNGVGDSSQCETSIVYTSPSAPSNVSAELNDTTITITWTDNSSTTDLHEIERSIDGGDWAYLDEDSDGTYQDTWQEAWTSVKYRVRSKATGPRYSSYILSNTVTSNQPPVAAFTSWGSGGTEITFDASETTDSDGDDLTFTWDMGDGTEETGEMITHDYKTGGQWTVTLTVSDGKAQDQAQETVSLNVSSGGQRPTGGTTPAEAMKEVFEIAGKSVKETAENAAENEMTPLIVIFVAIIIIVAYKRR